MQKLILLMAVLLPGVAIAQEMAAPNAARPNWVFVTDDNGVVIGKVNPTPQFALEAIQAEKEWGEKAAWTVLRQTAEARSAAELDAFADDLARLVLESPSEKVGMDAIRALRKAANFSTRGGIPYERGLEVLIGIYEAMDGTEAVSTFSLLISIFSAGGEDYLKNLFASLEPPEKPCWPPPQAVVIIDGQRLEPPRPPRDEWCPYKTQWCEVGQYLVMKGVVDATLVYPTCDNDPIGVH